MNRQLVLPHHSTIICCAVLTLVLNLPVAALGQPDAEEEQAVTLEVCLRDLKVGPQPRDQLTSECSEATELVPCVARTAGKLVGEGVMQSEEKEQLQKCLSDRLES
jgi:hypothetical protein